MKDRFEVLFLRGLGSIASGGVGGESIFPFLPALDGERKKLRCMRGSEFVRDASI